MSITLMACLFTHARSRISRPNHDGFSGGILTDGNDFRDLLNVLRIQK